MKVSSNGPTRSSIIIMLLLPAEAEALPQRPVSLLFQGALGLPTTANAAANDGPFEPLQRRWPLSFSPLAPDNRRCDLHGARHVPLPVRVGLLPAVAFESSSPRRREPVHIGWNLPTVYT